VQEKIYATVAAVFFLIAAILVIWVVIEDSFHHWDYTVIAVCWTLRNFYLFSHFFQFLCF
jgi:hypothetical protein